MNDLLKFLDDKIDACEQRAEQVDEELKFVYLDAAQQNREFRTAVAALIARNAELEADRDHLLTSLRIIRDCEFFGGDEWLQAVEVLQKMAGNAIAHNEKAQAARAEAGHG